MKIRFGFPACDVIALGSGGRCARIGNLCPGHRSDAGRAFSEGCVAMCHSADSRRCAPGGQSGASNAARMPTAGNGDSGSRGFVLVSLFSTRFPPGHKQARPAGCPVRHSAIIKSHLNRKVTGKGRHILVRTAAPRLFFSRRMVEPSFGCLRRAKWIADVLSSNRARGGVIAPLVRTGSDEMGSASR